MSRDAALHARVITEAEWNRLQDLINKHGVDIAEVLRRLELDSLSDLPRSELPEARRIVREMGGAK